MSRATILRVLSVLAGGLLPLSAAMLSAQEGATEKGTKASSAAPEGGDSDAGDAKSPKKTFATTHKQSRIIPIKHDGKTISLNTFCLAPNGDILACVGGAREQIGFGIEGEAKAEKSPSLVQVYAPDGTLKTAYKVDFRPTAINLSPKGEIVVAGQGKIARLSSDGKLIKQAMTPNVGDFEKFKKEALAAAKKEVEEYTKQFREQIKAYDEQIAEITKTPEKERTTRQKQRVKALEAAKQTQQQFCDEFEKQAGGEGSEEAILDRLTVTSIGVTEKDVFVCCRSQSGHGYEVWRCDYDFANGESIVKGLSGCCGQLDIQAAGEKLYVAENGRFRVATYDRDGEMESKFGKRDAEAPDGFGSCCNPMNMRCLANGDLLVAESSIGNIKRFKPDGELVAFVGKARISGGCKHVAIGWDEKRDAYYMMHVDKSHICVLVPNAQATDTDEEKAARAAREGLGKKLAGTAWVRAKATKQPDKKQAKRAEQTETARTDAAEEGGAEAVSGVFSLFSSRRGSSAMFDSITFQADRKVAAKGGQFGDSVSGTTWEPTRQTDDTLDVQLMLEGAEFYGLRVRFLADDKIELSMVYDENVLGKETYQLQKTSPARTTARPAKPEKGASDD